MSHITQNYSYDTPIAYAGAFVDTSPHSVNSRINGETDSGAMLCGIGVVKGTVPGTHVTKPTSTSTSADFEGITLAVYRELDMDGEIKIKPKETLGVLDWGRLWARIKGGVNIAYGDKVYMIKGGADAGKFTNVSGTDTMSVKAKFVGKNYGALAPIELYNQINE